MNPTDFLLLFASNAVALLHLTQNSWTSNGIGPALLSTSGGFWLLWMQYLRQRSWVRHRDTGFAPGTQHLALAASLGWAVAMTAGFIWASFSSAQ